MAASRDPLGVARVAVVAAALTVVAAVAAGGWAAWTARSPRTPVVIKAAAATMRVRRAIWVFICLPPVVSSVRRALLCPAAHPYISSVRGGHDGPVIG